MRSDYSISVVVPIYNERLLIKSSLLKIHSFLKKHFIFFEIIIVESGSTDGSAKICDDLALEIPRVMVIHEGEKRGYGSALKLGFDKAQNDLIWPVTVDLPFPLSTILRAMPLLSKYDCILSFRSRDKRKFPRRFQSFIFNSICKFALNLPVTHVNSAFKVFKRKILGRFQVKSKGWFFDAEFVWQLEKHKIPFAQIGVALVDRKRGRSTVAISAALETLGELWRFLKNRR